MVPNSSQSFVSSRTTCNGLGGDLAIFDSQQKVDRFTDFYYNQLSLNWHVWIGLKDHQLGNGSYIPGWVNNAELIFTNFYSSGNTSFESCFAMRKESDHGWFDQSCTNNHFFVCEKGMYENFSLRFIFA